MLLEFHHLLSAKQPGVLVNLTLIALRSSEICDIGCASRAQGPSCARLSALRAPYRGREAIARLIAGAHRRCAARGIAQESVAHEGIPLKTTGIQGKFGESRI